MLGRRRNRTIRKLVALLVVAGMVLSFVPAGVIAVEAPGIGLAPSKTSVSTGEEFTVTVEINQVSGFIMGQVHMAYDANVLEVVGVTGGSIVTTPTTWNEFGVAFNIPGEIDYGAGSMTLQARPSGSLAIITFRGKAAGTSNIAFSGSDATNEEGIILVDPTHGDGLPSGSYNIENTSVTVISNDPVITSAAAGEGVIDTGGVKKTASSSAMLNGTYETKGGATLEGIYVIKGNDIPNPINTQTLTPVMTAERKLTSGVNAGQYSTSINLNSGDNSILVAIKDSEGRVAPAPIIAIIRDTQSTAGTVTIAGGAVRTGRTDVSLGIDRGNQSDITGLVISNTSSFTGSQNIQWPDAQQNYTNLNWTLAAGADGARNVYVKLVDNVGNQSPVFSDSIDLDTSASIEINTNAAYTKTQAVQLKLRSATASSAVVANTANTAGGQDVPIQDGEATVQNWNLSAGDGTKTVYVSFKGAQGAEINTANDSIVLDTTLPTLTVELNPINANGSNGWYVTTPVLNVTSNDVTSGLQSVEYQTDGVNWQPYSAGATLSDGTYIVGVRATDNAGNVATETTGELKVRAIAPVTGVLVVKQSPDADAGWYKTPPVVTLTPEAGIQLQYGDSAGGPFTPVAGPWTDTIGNTTELPGGARTIYFKSVHASGKEEALRSLTFKVDTRRVTSGEIEQVMNLAKRFFRLSNSELRSLIDLIKTKGQLANLMSPQEIQALADNGLNQDVVTAMLNVIYNKTDEQLNTIRTNVAKDYPSVLLSLANELRAQMTPEFFAALDNYGLTFVDVLQALGTLEGISIDNLTITPEVQTQVGDILFGPDAIFTIHNLTKEALKANGFNWVTAQNFLNSVKAEDADRDLIKRVLIRLGYYQETSAVLDNTIEQTVSYEGLLNLVIPAGTFAAPYQVTVRGSDPTIEPQGVRFGGSAITFTFSGVGIGEPGQDMSLSLATPADLNDIDANRISLFMLAGADWTKVVGSVTSVGTTTGMIGLAGAYVVGGDYSENPVTSISISPTSPNGMEGWYKTRPAASFTVDRLGTTTYYKHDGMADYAVYSPATPVLLPEGSNVTLMFYSDDNQGNIEDPQVSVFKVDTTLPTVTATLQPPQPDGDNGWYKTRPSVTLTPSDPNNGSSGIKEAQYSLNGTDYQTYTNPVLLPEGSTSSLWYRALDRAGNLSQVQQVSPQKVDITAPQVQAVVSPPQPDGTSGWYRTKPAITLTSENGALIEYRFNNGNWQVYSGSVQLPEGANVLVGYRAKDSAGNQGQEQTLNPFKVDATKPTTTATLNPANPDGADNATYMTAPVMTLSSSEPGITQYAINGTNYLDYTNPVTLTQGRLTVFYRSTDLAGNRENAKTLTVRVDTTDPAVQATVSQGTPDGLNGWYITSPQVILSSELGASIYATLGSQDQADIPAYTGTISIPDGSHTLRFYARDAAGNEGQVQSLTFKVDLQDPALNSVVVNDGQGVALLEGTFLKAGGTIQIRATGAAGALKAAAFISGINKQVTLAETQAGIYTGTYTVQNGDEGYGIVSAILVAQSGRNSDQVEADTAVAFDTVKPELYVDSLATIVKTGAQTLSGSLLEDNLDKIEYSMNQAAWVNITPAEGVTSFIANVNLAEGANNIRVQATDKAGNVSNITQQNITLDTQAPVVDSSDTAIDGAALTIAATITENGAAGIDLNNPLAVTVTLDEARVDLTGRVNIQGGVVSIGPFNVNPGEGSHTVVVRAMDRAGNIGIDTRAGLRIDTKPPTTATVVSPREPNGQNGWYKVKPTINLKTETGATLNYRVGTTDAFIQVVSTGETVTVPIPDNLDGGANGVVVEFYSVDTSNNTEAQKQFSFKFDTTAPGTPAVTSVTNANPAAEGQEEYDYTSSQQNVTIQATAEANSWVSARVNGRDIPDVQAVGNGTVAVPVNLAREKVNTIVLSARDAAGNKGGTTEVKIYRDIWAPTFNLDIDDTGSTLTVIVSEELKANPVLTVSDGNGARGVPEPVYDAEGLTYTYTFAEALTGTVTASVTGTDLVDNPGSGSLSRQILNNNIDNEVSFGDGNATIDIPEGGLNNSSETLSGSSTDVNGDEVPDGVNPGNAFDFTFTGQGQGHYNFNNPVDVLLALGGLNPGSTVIFMRDPFTGQWRLFVIPTIVFGQASFQTDQFSGFMVGEDTLAPAVDLDVATAGLQGTRVKTQSVTVSGTMTDNITLQNALLKFYVDNINEQSLMATIEIGEIDLNDTSEAFSQAINLGADGQHTIYVVAEDQFGNTTQASPTTINLTLDTVANLNVTAPVDAVQTGDDTINLTGTAEDGTLAVTRTAPDGSEITASYALTGGNNDLDVALDLAEGTNTIEAILTDLAGNTATVNRTVLRDSVAELTVVDTAALVKTVQLNLSGTTEPGNTIAVTLNNADQGAVNFVAGNGNNASFSKAVNLAEGSNSIKVQATSPRGNVNEVTRAVVLDTQAQLSAITVNGANLSGGTYYTASGSVTLTGTSESGATVTAYRNGTAVTTSTNTNFALVVPLSTAGTYTLRVGVVDEAGNQSTSNDITVERDTTAPVATFTGTLAGVAGGGVKEVPSDTAVTVSGMVSEEASNIALLVDGVASGNGAGNNFSFNLGQLAAGSKALSLQVTDRAGNMASMNVTLQVSTPTLAVITVTGNAPADWLVGDTFDLGTFTVDGKDQFDRAINTGQVTWSSGETNVATVAGSTLTAVGEGFGDIIAQAGGVNSNAIRFTAGDVAPVLNSIAVAPAALQAQQGANLNLAALVTLTGKDQKNNNFDLTGKQRAWFSSNTAVATINGETVTAAGAGTSDLTVVIDNITSSIVTLTVSAVPVLNTLQAAGQIPVLTTGGNYNLNGLTLSGKDQNDNNFNLAGKAATWESENTNIATVAGTTLTAVAAGQTRARATIDSIYSNWVNVTVNAPPAPPGGGGTLVLNQLILSGSITGLKAGDNFDLGTLGLAGKDQNGNSYSLAGKAVTWSSSDSNIASISGSTLTAKAEGTMTITATVEGKTSNGLAATVAKAEQKTAQVTVSGTVGELKVGDTFDLGTLVVTAKDDKGASVDLAGKTITWSSSNNSVASISGSTLTAKTSGTASIIAVVDGKSSNSIAVNVVTEATKVSTVTLGGTIGTLKVGDTFDLGTLTVAAKDDKDNSLSLTGRTTAWWTSNSSVASISGSTLTARAEGTASITVTVDGKASNSITLTVTAAAPKIATVTLSGTIGTLKTGDTANLGSLNVAAKDDKGNAVSLAGKIITWSSSDSNVASISGSTLTAKAEGTATITATVDGKTSDAITATVARVEQKIAQVTLGGALVGVRIGDSADLLGNLTVTAEDDKGNAVSLTGKTITWSSGNSSVATVSGSILKAVGTGNVTVTATVDGITSNGFTVTVAERPTLPADIVQDEVQKQVDSGALVVQVTVPEGVTGGAVEISASTLAILDQASKTLEVRTEEIVISVPAGSLQVPAGSVVKIGAQPVSSQETQQITSGLGTLYTVAGQVFELSAVVTTGNTETKATFSKPLTVTIAYSGDVDEDKLGVYTYDEEAQEWVFVGGVVDRDKKVVTFTVTHFSKYTVMEYNRTFADISGHWAKGDIEVMTSRHVVNGISNELFAPNDKVTRAQFAAMLLRSLGIKPDASLANPFSDVAKGKWYYADVVTAYKQGLIAGVSKNTFAPDEAITREQLALMVTRAMSLTGQNVELSPLAVDRLLGAYSDSAKLASWARQAMAIAIDQGIVNGRGANTLAPKATASRAEAAVMLKRFQDR